MFRATRLVAPVAAGILLVILGGPAAAARLRYLYGPDGSANGCVKLCGSGERLTLRGWQPYNCDPPRATHLVSFRHPGTGLIVTVPLALPPDTPHMEYGRSRVIYNYGSDTVEVSFLAGGSVHVIYDSGLLRAP